MHEFSVIAAARAQVDIPGTLFVAGLLWVVAVAVQITVEAARAGRPIGEELLARVRRVSPFLPGVLVVLVTLVVAVVLYGFITVWAVIGLLQQTFGDESGSSETNQRLTLYAAGLVLVAAVGRVLGGWLRIRAFRRSLARRREAASAAAAAAASGGGPRPWFRGANAAVACTVVLGTGVWSAATLPQPEFGGPVEASACPQGNIVRVPDSTTTTTPPDPVFASAEEALAATLLPAPPFLENGQPSSFRSERTDTGADLIWEGTSYLPFEELVALRDAAVAGSGWETDGGGGSEQNLLGEHRKVDFVYLQLSGVEPPVEADWMVETCGEHGRKRLSVTVHVGPDRVGPCGNSEARHRACVAFREIAQFDISPSVDTPLVLPDGRLQVHFTRQASFEYGRLAIDQAVGSLRTAGFAEQGGPVDFGAAAPPPGGFTVTLLRQDADMVFEAVVTVAPSGERAPIDITVTTTAPVP